MGWPCCRGENVAEMLVAGFPQAVPTSPAALSSIFPSCPLPSLLPPGPSAFSAATVPAQASASLTVILLLLLPSFVTPSQRQSGCRGSRRHTWDSWQSQQRFWPQQGLGHFCADALGRRVPCSG